MLFGGVSIPGCPDLDNVARLDRLPIPFIRRAHRLGIAIDREYFHSLTSEFSAKMVELEKDIASYIPTDRLHEFADRAEAVEEADGDASFNAGSAEQIGKLLFDMLGVGEGKELKRTKGGDRLSTGKKQLETVRLEHPIVPLILRHRELKKLKTTYTVKLPLLTRFHPAGGCCPICELPHSVESYRVHGEMGTTRAATGRINHKNPNLGNIPSRTDDGQRVQAGFIAPRGKRLVANDLSQIELRTLAHLSNDPVMIKIYAEDGDIHDITARVIFNLAPDVKPDKVKHRLPSKRVAFSVANGTTEKGIYAQLVMDYGTNGFPIPDWLTEEWCLWFMTQWLAAYDHVEPYFDQSHYRARRYGLVWEPLGRFRLIPEVKSTHSWIKQAGDRQAQNFAITSFAAGLLKLGMGQADESLEQVWDGGRGGWVWPLLTIHDSIMVEADEEIAEEVLEVLSYSMDTVMEDRATGEHCFRTPIKSDGEVMEPTEMEGFELVSRWKK